MTLTSFEPITDIHDFSGLPDGTVIIDGEGHVGEKLDWPLDLAVRYTHGVWKTNDEVPLPIRVLYTPGERPPLPGTQHRNWSNFRGRVWDTPEEIPEGVTFIAATVPEVRMGKPPRRWYRVVWPTKFRIRTSKLRELGPFHEVKDET